MVGWDGFRWRSRQKTSHYPIFKITSSHLHKNRSWIVWIGILILIFLAGCSPTPPDAPVTTATGTTTGSNRRTPTPTRRLTPTPPKNSPVAQLDLEADDLNGLEVTFWHSWDGELGVVMDQLVTEFNQENEWGVRVRAEYQGSLDELDRKARQMADVEQKPQLIAAYLYQALNWGSDVQLVALDEFVNDLVWGISEAEQDDFYPAIWQAEIVQGQRWGVPALRSGQFLYYNETWASELGYELAPQNWSQLEQQVCAANSTFRQDDTWDNDGRGGLGLTTDYTATLSWLVAFGTMPVDKTGAYQFDTPPVEDAFERLWKLSDRGCGWLVENGSPVEIFASRESLVTTGSLLEAPVIQQAMERAGRRDRWRLLPFIGTADQPTFIHYGPAYTILSSTPEEELAAWVFVRWMLAPERQARWIEASGGLPLQRSIVDDLGTYANRNPFWAQAVVLLPDAAAEPTQASWKTVRWAVSDATIQLFRYYFTLDQVPELAELLNKTAQELNER